MNNSRVNARAKEQPVWTKLSHTNQHFIYRRLERLKIRVHQRLHL